MTAPPSASSPSAAPLPSHLLVRLSATAMHLARYDAAAPSDFAFATLRLNPQVSLTANVRDALRREPLLQVPTEGNVRVLVSGAATFVPLAEFQEEDTETLHAYCLPPKEGERRRVFYDVMPAVNGVVLFSVPEASCRAIEELSGEQPHFVSAFTPLINHFAAKDAVVRDGRKRFHIYVHEHQATIIVLQNGRLLLANTYAVGSVADVAYFTFAVARQVGAALTPSSGAGAETRALADAFLIVADERPLRDKVIEELRHFAKDVLPVNPVAEYNRHVCTVQPAMPYDLLTFLLD